VDLAAAIRTACQLHGYGAEPALPITVDVPSGVHVDAEPMQLETAVLRLLLLASRRGAASVAIRGDRLELAARSDAYPGLRAGRYGCLEVEYSGVALPPRLLCAHAEPGHVLDRLGDPDGLEFAAVEAFVHALRGRLMASNGPGGKARIDLYLPLGVAG
jgi:hypothetical protein